MFFGVTHMFFGVTHMFRASVSSAHQLDQFRTVTHMFRAAIHMKFKFQIWRAQTSRCTLAPCLNVSTGWLKDVNQHDNCSNNIRYYPIYILNNTAMRIVEGVITTVFMLILYYTIYVAGWSASHNSFT